MIVKMVKIMIMGPADLLMLSLDYIQKLGILQIDKDSVLAEKISSSSLEHKKISKKDAVTHQLYRELKKQIEDLLRNCSSDEMPIAGDRTITGINKLITLLPLHIKQIRKRMSSIGVLRRKIQEYKEYKVFLDTVGEIDEKIIHNELAYIAVELKRDEDVDVIQTLIEKQYAATAALDSVLSSDGKSRFGIIVVEQTDFDKLKEDLEKRKFVILTKPLELESSKLADQKIILEKILKDSKEKLESLVRSQKEFEKKWLPSYRETHKWLDAKISVFDVSATVVKTRMCFFIHGWLPATKYVLLTEKLEEKFAGKVVAEQCELVEEDFSRIPTALHNPAYFEPFELFSRLLPLPPYTSFDITPFIGIFLPIFFGMMLGDIGYGFILLGVSVFLIRKYAQRKNILDAGKILFVCSLYTIVFGILYGELLGSLGHDYLGIEPIGFDRRESILPMMCFAIAAGVVHVIIGLILGAIVSFRRRMKKEATFKIVNILVILCLCVLLISYFTESMEQVQKPLLLTIAIVIPAAIIVGGLMAPLELLKNLGNIISYARIMAVGLTSVLLAYVANFMAGRVGSIWAGILVAILLHAFNLLLGVFAPTIHSLRLHYVEFLSKFMEPGGKVYKPLGRQ